MDLKGYLILFINETIMIESLNAQYITILFVLTQLSSMMNTFLPIIRPLMLLLGYYKYKITTRETGLLFKSKIHSMPLIYNSMNENQEPSGTIIHRSLIPQFIIYEHQDHYHGFIIFCRKEFYKNIFNKDYKKKEIVLDDDFVPQKDKKETNKETKTGATDEDDIYKHKQINLVTRYGNMGYFEYNLRKIDLTLVHGVEHKFFKKQEELYKSIMMFYKTQNYCKVFLAGEPGSGKTFFSYLMAQKLDCYFCDTYDPYLPSSSFMEVYNSCKLKPEKPLIVVLDEVDILLNKIMKNQAQTHEKYCREIHDKLSWNNFMDKIDYGLYPYVIFVMNSNMSKDKLMSTTDPSLLRKGRIDIAVEW